MEHFSSAPLGLAVGGIAFIAFLVLGSVLLGIGPIHVLIGMAVVAVYANRLSPLLVPSIINAGLAFWGNGVLANFGPDEAEIAPDWAAMVSIVTGIGTGILLIASAFV